uniref:Uncharacterized protein n=1 Tax=Eptatretus burgeri TaxID=7764 RepID=A0A8C4QGY4_EPTBU
MGGEAMSVIATKSTILRSSEALFSSGRNNPFRKPTQRPSHYHPSPEKTSQSHLEMPLGPSPKCLMSSKDGLACHGIKSRIPVVAASPPTRQAPARRGKTGERAAQGRVIGSSKKRLHGHVDTTHSTRGVNASERKMLVKHDDDVIRDTEVCVKPDAVTLDGRSSAVGDRDALRAQGREEVQSGEPLVRVDQHEPHVGGTSPDFPPLLPSSSCSLSRPTMSSNSKPHTVFENAEEVPSRQPSIRVDQHEPCMGGSWPRLSEPDFSVGVGQAASSECSSWSDIYGAAVLDSCDDSSGRHLRERSRHVTLPSQMKSNTDGINKEWKAIQRTTLDYDDEIQVRDLQKRAEQLLEKSNQIVNGATSERRHKTNAVPEPLGASSAQCVNTSPCLSSAGAGEELLSGWHHACHAVVPPKGDIRPEDDVLYQWRLRRQTEMANEDLRNRLARLSQCADTPLSDRLVYVLPRTPTVGAFVGHRPRIMPATETFPSMTPHLHLTYDLVPCSALQSGLGHVVEQRAVGGSDGRLAGDAGHCCDQLVADKGEGRSFNHDKVAGRGRERISGKDDKLKNSKIVKEFEQSKGVANRRDVLGDRPGNETMNRTRRGKLDSGNKVINEQRDDEVVKESVGQVWRRSGEWHKKSARDKRTGKAQPKRDGERQQHQMVNTTTQGCTKMAPPERSPIHATLGKEPPFVNEEMTSSTETMEGTSFSTPSAFDVLELAEDSDGSEFPDDKLLHLLRKQRASVLHKLRHINKKLLDIEQVRNRDTNPAP